MLHISERLYAPIELTVKKPRGCNRNRDWLAEFKSNVQKYMLEVILNVS